MSKSDSFRKRDCDEAIRKKEAIDVLFRSLTEDPRIALVHVDYDGCGGRGHVANFAYFDRNDSEINPGDRALNAAVQEYVYAFLPIGWENNEGSHGTVDIDVVEGKSRFSHSERVMEGDTDRREWTFVDDGDICVAIHEELAARYTSDNLIGIVRQALEDVRIEEYPAHKQIDIDLPGDETFATVCYRRNGKILVSVGYRQTLLSEYGLAPPSKYKLIKKRKYRYQDETFDKSSLTWRKQSDEIGDF